MQKLEFGKLTFWKGFMVASLALGIGLAVFRFSRGLGAATHLSDSFPWGLWIGFDVLTGVALAAGGFTIAAAVYIFRIERFRPILRPTILTAFLGYLMVMLGLVYDLGRPDRVWHAVIMWNPRSVMFEVAWCVMLYTTVLALEFSPMVLEKLRWKTPLRVVHGLLIPLVIVGVLLSTLHQSSLGSLYLIVPHKLYGLWYSSMLPLFFFISAVAVGLAMTIFESFLSARAFRRHIEMDLLSDLGRVLAVVLAVYFVFKAEDLVERGVLSLLIQPRTETALFYLEMILGVIVPMALLASEQVRRSPRGLYTCALCVILGVVLNRLNVSITGMAASAGADYFPSWIEVGVSIAIVTTGFTLFALAVRYLNVFPSEVVRLPASKAVVGSPIQPRLAA
ncbi:MAG: Ni/Fe-hydrogenase cytochrome b subunit [Candidatus Tectomicrobia bacterium]|uniref:Ni/Fe-hydrogenase cytochrome b subunit n=1 Tax=Tectimicrobiota bacterium TaxID=2528274 RepID=A0A932GSG5_UNCTE|nr:Ni/Fe-hydrogenase cytochrome b subunit [Candidatus Tectomicrobia bacterium]